MSDPKDEVPAALPIAPIETAAPLPRNKGGRPRKNVTALPLSERDAPQDLPPPRPVEEPVDESGLLTKSEIAALRAEARDEAMAERKKAVRAKIKAKFFKEERGKLDPSQEMVTFRLDLAEYADGAMIDGVKYFHNGLYTVPRAKYDVFAEQMYRSVEHENQKDGKGRADLARRLYREKQPGATVSGKAA